jgi:hypothetical protein
MNRGLAFWLKQIIGKQTCAFWSYKPNWIAHPKKKEVISQRNDLFFSKGY